MGNGYHLCSHAAGVHVLDTWYNRFVIARQLSNTPDGSFCLDTLQIALRQGKPEIFKTDQDSQFKAKAFLSELEEAGVRVSMDGHDRFF